MTSPDHTELLALYDANLRGERELGGFLNIQQIGPLWVGELPARGFGFVTYTGLDGATGGDVDHLIDAAISHFEQNTDVAHFEWKTRAHDEPADLGERLRARGLVADDVEKAMLGSVDTLARRDADLALPEGLVARRAGSGGNLHADLERAIELLARVFGHPVGGLDELEQQIRSTPNLVSFWLLERDGACVSAGRINRVEGTNIASIWGGVTDENWRGRGLYRALVAARARWAAELGVEFLHSDTPEALQPLLEHAGFTAVTTTTPYLWSRN